MAILAFGVCDRLFEGAFEFEGGGGDAVDEQHQVEAGVVVTGSGMGRVGDFGHDAQAIGLVAGLGVGVHGVVRLKAAQLNFDAGEFEAVAQYVEGARFLEGADGLLNQHASGVAGVGFAEFLPALRPGSLEVGQQVFGVEGGGGVVACGGTHQPALGRQGVDNILLKGEFFTVGHGGAPRGRGGTQVKLSALSFPRSAWECLCGAQRLVEDAGASRGACQRGSVGTMAVLSAVNLK